MPSLALAMQVEKNRSHSASDNVILFSFSNWRRRLAISPASDVTVR